MRIAIANRTRRKVGGIEAYLGSIIPELVSLGHEVGFFHETDLPADRQSIPLPDGVPAWCVEKLGADVALRALRDWRPEVVYAHGMLAPELEVGVYASAPVVFFPHDYHGTCISGYKATRVPEVEPCHRRFGAGCLLHYFPKRCGGLNPVTMLRDYRKQSRRLEVVAQAEVLITNSRHMKAEYVRNGIDPDRVRVLPYYVYGSEGIEQLPVTAPGAEARLLFMGRMDVLKGGQLLLDALPKVAGALERPVHLTFAGDGPAAADWARQAAGLQAADNRLHIDFAGWVDGARREQLLAETEVVVVPSLWPEPFGRIGPEAGFYGLPVAAFATGGVEDWLTDGVNGHLAPATPPTAAGLAGAIAACLREEAHYAELRGGALRLARRFSREDHLDALLPVLESVASLAGTPADRGRPASHHGFVNSQSRHAER